MVYFIPNFDTKAQMPNLFQSLKLEKKKISKHLKLYFLKTIEIGIKAYKYIETKSKSPWKSFEKVFKLKMNNFITVAIQNAFLYKIVIIKTFKTCNKLNML